MVSKNGDEPKSPTPFEAWKRKLREDCQSNGKITAFQALGDPVLQILWSSGLDPSVTAICESAANAAVEHSIRMDP